MCKKSDKMICAVDKENLICFSVVFVEEFQNLFSTFKFTASFDKKKFVLERTNLHPPSTDYWKNCHLNHL